MSHEDDMIFVLSQIATDLGGMHAEMVSGLLYFRDLYPTVSPEVLAMIIDRQIMDGHVEAGYDLEDYDKYKISLVMKYIKTLAIDYPNYDSAYWEEVYNCYYFESGFCAWTDDVWNAYMNVIERL